MLTGHLENCYGIKTLDIIPPINFTKSNKAIIYAANGVMKTSFARVLDDISHGEPSKDRIYTNQKTFYSIKYNENLYQYSSEHDNSIPPCKNIYVINSIQEKYDFTKDTVNTLLSDPDTREEYDCLIATFSAKIKLIEKELAPRSGLTKPKIKSRLIEDFELPQTADWPDIITAIYEFQHQYSSPDNFSEIVYKDLLNEKALEIYKDADFKKHISEYIDRLNILLTNSELLSSTFTDRNAGNLTKSFESSNLFSAKHKIVLKSGKEIHEYTEWKDLVDTQIQQLYTDDSLRSSFQKLQQLLTANNDVDAARQIIITHRNIISYLDDIPLLKKYLWSAYCTHFDRSFEEYYNDISAFANQIRNLYARASESSDRWQDVIYEFNRRFRVPFTVKINNKSNFILKDEAPNISFVYSRGLGSSEECAELKKDNLIPCLSMGERRAMYLLYILFDLERIKRQASENNKILVVADDVADSFDYKNKYAIIEYLSDLSQNPGIELLVLTHNFDFYRNVKLRLDIRRENCLIAQKDDDHNVKLSCFRYQNDFFKKVILAGIKSSDDRNRKKMLIASIPFFRNLSEYSNNEEDYKKLTCFMHFKTLPLDTSSITMNDLATIVQNNCREISCIKSSEKYVDVLCSIADSILDDPDEISLENKLILSIAARLLAEKHLKQKIIKQDGKCPDSNSNQMRDWYNKAKDYLNETERRIMDDINLITPESIHLNSFMFEPLIDISIWSLKELYSLTKKLQ